MDSSEIDYLEPVSEADYKLLNDFLYSDKAPKETMLPDTLDGFLTALHCGPGLFLPSEWLPVIWGEGEPKFDSHDEAMTVIGIIFRIYNQIVLTLQAGEYCEPMLSLYKYDGTEYTIADDWCTGFLEGMKFWDPCWQEYFNEELSTLLGPILIAGAPQFDDELKDEGVDLDKLMEQLPDMLPAIVNGIYDHLAPCREMTAPGHTPPMRKNKKPGRNDPCPCGSGKKYKKCCAGLTLH